MICSSNSDNKIAELKQDCSTKTWIQFAGLVWLHLYLCVYSFVELLPVFRYAINRINGLQDQRQWEGTEPFSGPGSWEWPLQGSAPYSHFSASWMSCLVFFKWDSFFQWKLFWIIIFVVIYASSLCEIFRMPMVWPHSLRTGQGYGNSNGFLKFNLSVIYLSHPIPY